MAETKQTETKAVAKVDEQKPADNPLALIGGSTTEMANFDYSGGGVSGFENTSREDFKRPFLRVLQANSPQVETVEGAKAGKLINTISNQLFETAAFIPAITEHYYIEWVPREEGQTDGGGLVGAFPVVGGVVQSDMVKAALEKQGGKFNRGADGKVILAKSPDGNNLIETKYVYGLLLTEDGSVTPITVPFSSTQLPAFVDLMSKAQGETYVDGKDGKRKSKPLYAHAFKLGSVKTQKNGNTWYKMTVDFFGGSAAKSLVPMNSDLGLAAINLAKAVRDGAYKADHEQGAAADKAEGAGADSEIPF